MRITDGQLVDIIIKEHKNIDHILQDLQVVIKLFKKYGQSIYTNRLVEEIGSVNKNIADLCTILKKTKKNNPRAINNIIRLCKMHHEKYTQSFTIVAETKRQKDIQATIQKIQGEVHIEHKQPAEVWVAIQGEWKYFKRSLDKDLEKMLFANK